ncbi:MAG: NAD(P)/FAD-dependent oxidoreductase [Candidatus Rokubacteria bacterium]|nr:NAD(P)/FAD-dependent oxidoreductase [Candidatus Rokubacteria bacterium]
MTETARPDVTVVGGGPAGSAAAILLAERGFTVLLLEKAAFPRAKICGEYLSPECARVLDRLGVLKEVDAAAQPLCGMRIVAPDGTVLAGRYPTAGPWRGYRDHALALPREVLDGILLERARSIAVAVRERHRATGLIVEGDRVVGVRAEDPEGRAVEVRSRLVVGADGRASVVARSLGLVREHRFRRMAFIQDVEGLGDLGAEGLIHVDPPDYAILNPVGAGTVNLSLVVPLRDALPYRGRMERFFPARLKQFRHLPGRLAGMRPVGRLMVMGPLAYRVRAPRHGGVLLAGDASGFYDPFTGEGIYTALRSAELLAETARGALADGDLSRAALAGYDRARRLAFGGKARLTRALQLVIGGRRRANLAARALTRHPALLATLMGVIGDFVPPAALLRALRSPADTSGLAPGPVHDNLGDETSPGPRGERE